MSDDLRESRWLGFEKARYCPISDSKRFLEGTPISDWDSQESWIRSGATEDVGPPDDVVYERSDTPIFSSRLREVLIKSSICENDIQFLPLRLLDVDGAEVRGYSIVNVISSLAALDVSRSGHVDIHQNEIDPRTGQLRIAVVGRPVLNSASVAAFRGDMFRLVEYRRSIFVSERFAELFCDRHFSGAELSEVALS